MSGTAASTSAVGATWHELHALERAWGDEFFLLDLAAFRRNYLDLSAAFTRIYPATRVAYSYKTNYTPALCRMVDGLGGYAEVVSAMEYALAERLGVPGRRIVFNGPLKREPDIERALTSGAVVNVDGCAEIDAVERIAARHPRTPFRLGVRCNVDAGLDEPSRFGFDVDGTAFAAAVARLARLAGTAAIGLHCHVLTQRRSADDYHRIVRRLLEVARELPGGRPPAFIDVGGGFFSRMPDGLKRQFDHPIPTFADYAEALAAPMREAYGTGGGAGPELVLEPGLALAADVMRLVTKVLDVKRVRGRRVALVSSSIYTIKPTSSRRQLPATVVTARAEGDAVRPAPASTEAADTATDVVGTTCMEHDCLVRGHRGPIEPGDFVVIENVGAYTTVLRPAFITPAPPILAYDDDHRVRPIVRRQTAADVFAAFDLGRW